MLIIYWNFSLNFLLNSIKITKQSMALPLQPSVQIQANPPSAEHLPPSQIQPIPMEHNPVEFSSPKIMEERRIIVEGIYNNAAALKKRIEGTVELSKTQDTVNSLWSEIEQAWPTQFPAFFVIKHEIIRQLCFLLNTIEEIRQFPKPNENELSLANVMQNLKEKFQIMTHQEFTKSTTTCSKICDAWIKLVNFIVSHKKLDVSVLCPCTQNIADTLLHSIAKTINKYSPLNQPLTSFVPIKKPEIESNSSSSESNEKPLNKPTKKAHKTHHHHHPSQNTRSRHSKKRTKYEESSASEESEYDPEDEKSDDEDQTAIVQTKNLFTVGDALSAFGPCVINFTKIRGYADKAKVEILRSALEKVLEKDGTKVNGKKISVFEIDE